MAVISEALRASTAIVPRDRVSATAAGQILAAPGGANLRRHCPTPRQLPGTRHKERRRSPRVALACQVKFRQKTATPHAMGTVVDLSSTGVFIKTSRMFCPGTVIAGEIRSPDDLDQAIGFVGEVVRRGKRGGQRGFGVRLIYVFPRDHVRLRALVEAATSTPKKT